MTETDLSSIAASVLDRAQPGEDLDVMVSAGRSTSVRVFGGEVEAFTSAGSAAIGVRVIRDGRVGFAHAGSLDPDVVSETLLDARDNLAFSAVDPHAGLADPDGVPGVVHDQWSEDIVSMTAEEKIERALDIERRVEAGDQRITGVRVAAWSDAAYRTAYAATNGLSATERGTSCSLGVQALASDGDETQSGSGGTAARSPDGLDTERAVREVVERTVRLFGATKPASARLTILLEPRLAATLLGIVSGMLDGESVTKGRSPFAERLGQQVASPLLTLVDDPTRSESLAAETWDGEGLACRRTPLIVDGVLQGFLHNSATARRAGTTSTGSAQRGTRSLPSVGAQVLVVPSGERTWDQLVASIDHGLIVHELQGLHSGVNPVSGDFSVGAPGTMIRHGQPAEPVREVTIAGTLQRMLADIVEIGGDAEWLIGGDHVGSVVIADVSMAGV